MLNDEEFRALEREAAYLHEVASWLTVTVTRDANGEAQASAVVSANFQLDTTDLAGSVIREIHRRIDEFDSHIEE